MRRPDQPTATPPDAARPRVLLVDPHEQTRVRLGQLLADQGCEVVACVPNYAQGIVGARTHQPSVVVTEIIGGAPLTPEQYVASLRRHTDAPVIVHSVLVPAAGVARAWGIWGSVAKGGRPAGLLDMIRSAHASVTRNGR